MTNRKYLSVAAVVLLAAVSGGAVKLTVNARRASHPAYTMHSRTTQFLDDGSQRITEDVRYVSSDGGYRVVRNESGKVKDFFFTPGRGHFTVDYKGKKLVRDMGAANGPAPSALTAKQLRAHPQFNRTETISGFMTYVLRVTNEQTGQPDTDRYYAEELGWIPIKTVSYYDGRVAVITEPVSIVFGDPVASLVNGPDYPTQDQ